MRLGFTEGTEFFERMIVWFSSPSRRSTPINHFEQREKMCEKGREQFYHFLANPANDTAFLAHVEPTKKNGGCLKCRKVFCKYIESVTSVGDTSYSVSR